MVDLGYKKLIVYQLSVIAFQLGWEFVPIHYPKYEESRQRDQIKQALRSTKQNIVEGASERSLSTKLKLYDVAKSSAMEALEDFEDVIRLNHLSKWINKDYRIMLLRKYFETVPSSTSLTSYTSLPLIQQISRVLDVKDVTEGVANYEIDLLLRIGYLMDKLMNALEKKHETEGGYSENLLKRRLEYKRKFNN